MSAQNGAVAVDERFPFVGLRVDVNRLIAANDDRLHLLLAENAADRTRGVAAVDHEVRHGNAVFAGRPDRADARFAARFLGEHRVGAEGALAPDLRRVAKFNFLVFNVDVDRFGGFPFDDHEVPAGVLELVREFAAHVSGGNERLRPRGGPEGCDCGAARADGACARKRTRGDDELVGGVVAARFRGHFVPHDLVAEGRAADQSVKAREGGFDRDFSSRQVDAQALSCVAVSLFRISHFRNTSF